MIQEDKLNITGCYQCQKCSNGCPVAYAMDYKPHQVVQMINLGMTSDLLKSATIWLCASCYTCSTRCPNDVDVAGAMDWLRQKALAEQVVPAVKEVPIFHRAFLNSIRSTGRIHELLMMVRYKVGSKRYLDDMALGLKMFMKGKLKLVPSLVKNRKEIKAIFAKTNHERTRV